MADHLARFTTGFRTPVRGYRFLQQHPKLWRYTFAPVLLNVLISLLILALLVATCVWYARSIHPYVLTNLAQWGSWTAWTGSVMLAILVLLVVLAVAVLSGKLLGGILCGYLYGQLSEQVEMELGLLPSQLHSISFRYEVFDTSYRLGILLAVQLFFFGVGMMPIIGGPIALLGNFYCTWMVNGMDYLDIPLALRGLRYAEKRRFSLRHREETLGLGAAVFLFGLIPLVGAVLHTTAVVGAVLLHRDLQQSDEQVPAVQ